MTVSTGWDLHCHTAFSDGTCTPRELIEQAQQAGLAGVAISDHDTIAGWAEAKQASIDLNLPLIRGTEITAEYIPNQYASDVALREDLDADIELENCHSISVHILAYLYDCEDTNVLSLYEKMRTRRTKRIKKMVDKISRDYPISWELVCEQIREGEDTTVGRPHVADALVQAGVYETRSQAFEGIISVRSPYYIPVLSPSVQDVITALKAAGGVVVLAHCAAPARNKQLLSDGDIEKLAREYGLDGLELYHRDNPLDQQERLMKLAKRCNLLTTGGSDWHGAGKVNALGENLTDHETAMEIIHRGRIRVLP